MEVVPTRTGWPRLVAVLDLLHHGLEFFVRGLVDGVGKVFPDHLHVGGDDHHFQVVDLLELLGLGVGGAGHARQLFVHAEVVLEGDGGQGLVFVFDLDAFLGLQGLVQAVGVAPAGHEAAGEFVDDDDLAVLDDVVHVPLEEVVGLEGGLEVVQDLDVLGVVKVFQAHQLFGLGHAVFGNQDGAGLFVHGEVLLLLELPGHPVQDEVELGGLLGGAGDDQGRPGLVDEDGVHFVDDGVVEFALDVVLQGELHVVPQVVEAELVVGAVGDVRGIGVAALGCRPGRGRWCPPGGPGNCKCRSSTGCHVWPDSR